MKNFSIKIALFLLPILLFFIGLELFVQNDKNSFKTIANYFKENKATAEILILGSSHNQNGFNPEYFDKKTVNISYGSQDIKVDSALFFNNIKEMKELKTVIFELDYHRMDLENVANFYRYPWYYFYYDIEIYPLDWFNKISLYYSNPDFFNAIIKSKFDKNHKNQVINKFGYVEANYDNQFEQMKYDSIKIFNSAEERLKETHKEQSEKAFKSNKRRIVSIIEYCKTNNIKLYFLSSPLLQTYIDNKIENKNKKMIQLINELKSNYQINYIDFQHDTRFNIKDFRNDDHLNDVGAKKYSLILNEIIK